MFHKAGHDANPNVMVTNVDSFYVWGVNVHYLTFPYIRNLLQKNCNNIMFGYPSIKSDKFVTSAFRQYKKNGIRSLKKLDCDFVLNLLGSSRALTPAEVEAIRNTVNNQISQAINQVSALNPNVNSNVESPQI
jgi:hypothetical protein